MREKRADKRNNNVHRHLRRNGHRTERVSDERASQGLESHAQTDRCSTEQVTCWGNDSVSVVEANLQDAEWMKPEECPTASAPPDAEILPGLRRLFGAVSEAKGSDHVEGGTAEMRGGDQPLPEAGRRVGRSGPGKVVRCGPPLG